MANIFPRSRNVVPGRVFFSVEFRHPDEAVLARQHEQLHDAMARIAGQIGLLHSVKKIFQYAPIAFDSECVEVVRVSSEALGYSHRSMISGAGHDACYLNRVAPTAMIFVPCVDGISHNEAEEIHPHWATAGADVLLQSLLAKACI